MTLSIWRYAHLILAYISFLFITMTSITGVILSFRPIEQKLHPYKVEQFNAITLAETLPVLQNKYGDLTELNLDKNNFVSLEGFDEDGNDFKFYIDPRTGEKLGDPIEKSEFMSWVITLHRSLFLHETGRIIIGFMTFLLFLIAVSGLVLIIKRQKGFRNFFDKINKEYFSQYYHVIFGRIFLIPVIIISFTGTMMVLNRFELIPKNEKLNTEITSSANENTKRVALKDFSIFKETKLGDVRKIEFPFDREDPQEFYKINLTGQELIVNQINGKVEAKTPFSNAQAFLRLSSKLHTGHINIMWAVILAISCFSILFFIYSGFVITLKRTKTKILKNKYSAEEAEIVLLVGSENGSTLGFANKIQVQILANGKKSFMTQMNQYELYPNAKQIIIFTSTYGIGDAPSNANKFESLIEKYPQNQGIDFTVVGFGSTAYEKFCGYALEIDELLEKQKWANRLLPLKTVNDKSPEEFATWATEYKEKTDIPLATTPAMYVGTAPKLKDLKVISTSKVTEDDATFNVILNTKQKFRSGDLLAIYPANDHRERLYSVGKVNGALQLVVKLHEFGLGSQYLYKLNSSENFKARIVKNTVFHFPKKAKKVILIANGTGIAPFLGMIDENKKKIETHLYAGFRFHNTVTKSYESFSSEQIKKNHLTKFNIAFSREEQKQYVMDLVKRDEKFFAETLQNGGIIMICGALAMQHDIEKVLDVICQEHLGKTFEEFKINGQFLTDCY
ncbi:PepSY domain-containing protein [Chishuiella changwenlii]|uniref:PepSY domain-containing protein n=1 Tax=Chishuiella changwenlii TaxID=1434701 RepID=UPI002FDA1683